MNISSKHAQAYLKPLSRNINVIKFLTTGVGVALLAFSRFLDQDFVFAGIRISSTLFVAGLIFTLLGAFVLLFIDKNSADLIKDINNLENDLGEKEKEADFYKENSDYLASWLSLEMLLREFVDNAITGKIDKANINASIEQILELVAERKSILFGINDEYWNLAVYLPDSVGKKLECVACLRSRQSEGRKPHRSWLIGRGHVGKTFEMQSELICSDARSPDVAAWVTATGENFREGDLKRYVSLAAFPVAVERSQPLGVIILTSDQPGRFSVRAENGAENRGSDNKESAEPLHEVARFLAQIIYLVQNRCHTSEEARHAEEDHSEADVV